MRDLLVSFKICPPQVCMRARVRVVFSMKFSDSNFKPSFVFAKCFVFVILLILSSSISLPFSTAFVERTNRHEVSACVCKCNTMGVINTVIIYGKPWHWIDIYDWIRIAFILFPIEFKCASDGFFFHFSVYFWFTPHGVIRSENKATNIFFWKWPNNFLHKNQNKYSTKIVRETKTVCHQTQALSDSTVYLQSERQKKNHGIAITQ